METSYKKLWKKLIDRDMTKTELRMRSGISTMALAKLGKGENVSIEVLKKICATLECDIGDIMTSKAIGSIKKRKIQKNSSDDFLSSSNGNDSNEQMINNGNNL